MELLGVGGLASLVIIMVFQGKQLEEFIPILGVFTAAGFRILPSIQRILNAIQHLRFGLPTISTLTEELKLSIPDFTMNKSQDIHFKDTLKLDRISYTYPGISKMVLNNISLEIRKGESIGLIGESGVGKSTLVDIILGLLSLDHGEVKIDGKNIQQSLRNWQNKIGYVPQSIYLCDDTICKNVAFGLSDEEIDKSLLKEAIRSAQLEKFVKSLPSGLDTTVGERGVRISGGQRQRIGIARALYHNPEVLVLDEATSSLDINTEKGVIDAVNVLRGNKTIIIVTHRLTTVEQCDRIYRLQEGKIVAEGIPQTMLKNKSTTLETLRTELR